MTNSLADRFPAGTVTSAPVLPLLASFVFATFHAVPILIRADHALDRISSELSRVCESLILFARIFSQSPEGLAGSIPQME